MNWRLVLRLSMFGLAMAVATVFVIPSTIEPLFWLGIFIVCAYVIARRAPGRSFLHGVCVGVANSVWMTSGHILLFSQYIGRHPSEAAMMTSMPLPTHPRLMMAIMGPVIGFISGVVLGLFAVVAGRFTRRGRGRPSASSGPPRRAPYVST